MEQSKAGLIKHTFFNHSSKKYSLSFREDEFSLEQLKTEFSSMYQLYVSNRGIWRNHAELVNYLSYLNQLLIRYYQEDYVRFDMQQLKQRQKEMEVFFKEGTVPAVTRIESDPFSFVGTAALRNKIGKLNGIRTQFNQSRALAIHAITYLQKSAFSEFIHKINLFLGNSCSFSEGIHFLKQTQGFLTDLGIALNVLQFLINLITMIKHLVLSAKNKELSSKKVLGQELEKRGVTMASDLVWATVNLCAAYPHFFHISRSFVAPIILGFLAFDALMLCTQWFFETYKYNARLHELTAQKNNASILERQVISRQLDLLNDEWEAQCAYFAINVLGANFLMLSFAISMLCTGTLALAGLAFFSMLGNALYNSVEEYKKYQKARIAIRRELSNATDEKDEVHQELMNLLTEECNQARTEFWSSLAFNTGGIAFLITAAAASWPIALALTLSYLVYRLHKTSDAQLDHQGNDVNAHDIYRFKLDFSTDPTVPMFHSVSFESIDPVDELRGVGFC